MRRAFLVAALLFASPARADDFWKFWGDGKAELAGYTLVQPRYGANRDGTAVTIFVTEDFSDSLRVKADPGKHPPSDVYPVLKLNFVRDFQTGIYDYNLLTSTFVKAEGAMEPVKVSFSAQEWCGHVYQQLTARGGKLTGELHSYFDGEADSALELPIPVGGVQEDAIPILVRGLRADWLKPGESRVVPFLPSALHARFAHVKQAWGEATVKRSDAASTVQSALGSLKANTYSVAVKGGATTTWTVEEAWPHRILAWTSTDGESGKITGAARLPYWTLNHLKEESYLKQIGLAPGSMRAKK